MTVDQRGRSNDFPPAPRRNRPSFHLSDVWRAPLHDLPIRDEILFQYLTLNRDMRALEVGPGSGYTAFRVSRLVRGLTLAEVGADNVVQLRRSLARLRGVKIVCADLCDPGFADVAGGPFDAVWAIEVFELLPDPEIALHNLAAVVAGGATLLLQFPNYPPTVSPGPTHYETREAFDAQMRDAGFSRWAVFSVSLRPRAGWLYHQLHERPVNTLRRLRTGRSQGPPLTYDETWAFREGHRLTRYRALLHAAWGGLLAAMRLGGGVFERTLLHDDIFNKNLLVLARREGAPVFVMPAAGGLPADNLAAGTVGSRRSRPAYRLEPLIATEAERWDDLVRLYETRELFHRRTWLNYLAESRGAEIRLWRIRSEGTEIGYFCAGLLKKGPFKILGSPLRGWGTNSMGPVVHRDVDQDELLDALDELCRDQAIAMAELEHPLFGEQCFRAHGYDPMGSGTYLVDLRPGPDALWRTLHGTCRNRIRKARKLGLRAELTRDPAVVDEFYDQYRDVLRRKGLVPPYPRDTALQLRKHLDAADLLFAVRVRDRNDRTLATGLFPHDERTVYFWGGASVHDALDSCPNDLLHWHLICQAAERGLRLYNMCGDGRFKGKFGGAHVSVTRWRKYYRPGARLAHRAYELYLQAWLGVRGRFARLSAREASAVSLSRSPEALAPRGR
jgi:SAM-dependent methyltransferase